LPHSGPAEKEGVNPCGTSFWFCSKEERGKKGKRR